MTNEELYVTKVRITEKIQERKMRFTGHNTRQAGTPSSKLILWEQTPGGASRGRPAPSYVEVLKSDASVT